MKMLNSKLWLTCPKKWRIHLSTWPTETSVKFHATTLARLAASPTTMTNLVVGLWTPLCRQKLVPVASVPNACEKRDLLSRRLVNWYSQKLIDRQIQYLFTHFKILVYLRASLISGRGMGQDWKQKSLPGQLIGSSSWPAENERPYYKSTSTCDAMKCLTSPISKLRIISLIGSVLFLSLFLTRRSSWQSATSPISEWTLIS